MHHIYSYLYIQDDLNPCTNHVISQNNLYVTFLEVNEYFETPVTFSDMYIYQNVCESVLFFLYFQELNMMEIRYCGFVVVCLHTYFCKVYK